MNITERLIDMAAVVDGNPGQLMLDAAKEIERLNKDAARLDWMEGEAATSRTGVSIDYRKYVEDGCVLEKGYRLMRYHKIFEARPSLREAIDAAMTNP